MLLWVILSLLSGVFMVFSSLQSLLSLGVGGLVFSILMSLFLGLTFSYWVGMVVFLIYVGGLMVLFCYFIIITPNQRFRVSLLSMGLFFFLFFFFCDFSEGLVDFSLGVSSMDISGLYSFLNFPMIMVLGLMLLMTLIGVVELVEMGYGPLRSFSSKQE